MEFSIKLLESDKQIYNKILTALLPEINEFLKSRIKQLQQEFSDLIYTIITNTAEYESISRGKLKYEFGLVDSDAKLAGLLDIWSTNIVVNYQPARISNTKIISSFSVSAIKIDFSDVLYTDYALMTDNLRGYSLPWLEWLLLEGNKTIIKNQQVVFGPNRYSRTGQAIMKASTESWSVPSEFAGTINDNWITRAIFNAENDINNVLTRIFI